MTPLKLYLKGFAGIRSGLRTDELRLDLEALPAEATLVAIAGLNGTGKTTVMDNLQPYRLLPSRATSFSPAGFSYYEHLVLPESVKELEWAHEGRRYRSTLVLRMNGKRRTEAYLHVLDGGQWKPVVLPDGTVADGKTETYDRAIEALLGSPETFFTSVFCAQGRRPISASGNAEVKSLMVDLLGLERIRKAGESATQVARLLKVGLEARRTELAGVRDAEERATTLRAALATAEADASRGEHRKEVAAAALASERERLVRLEAEAAAAAERDGRRRTVEAGLARLRAGHAEQLQRIMEDAGREQARRERIGKESAARVRGLEERERHAHKGIAQAELLLARRAEIVQASARAVGLAVEEETARRRVERARARLAARDGIQRERAILAERAVAIEREAGQATLRADALKTRLALANEVPCLGTDLQPRCKLLGDAHEARRLMPSADGEIARLREAREAVARQAAALAERISALGDVDSEVRAADAAARELSEERVRVGAVAALAPTLGAAEGELTRRKAELSEIRLAREADRAQAAVALAEIDLALDTLRRRHAEETARFTEAERTLTAELAALPPAFDASGLADQRRAVERADAEARAAEKALGLAIEARGRLRAGLEEAERDAAAGRALREGLGKIEAELGYWNLLGKALGHDGVIALCIDDAGPGIARFANDLLLACYGPRFIVAIKTQAQNAKGELREQFDVQVFDADTGQAKSVSVMSGGERVWINECLTRAIALYLASASGRRYGTLFCDEADGALDAEKKRQFIAMKREVLRVGGYAREYFVSQTPELTALADAVIDIETHRAGVAAGTAA